MKKIIVFLIVTCFIIISFASEALSQGEEEGLGQSIIDILKAVLPPNPNRTMQLDEKIGRIVIRDTPSNHKIISQIITDLDKEPDQVEIEVRFVELQLTDEDEIGFHWGSTFLWYDWGPAPDVSPLPSESVPGQKVPKWRFSPPTGEDLVHYTATATGGLNLAVAKLNTNTLDFYIHALEKADKANLLSSPKVTTMNGQPANIQIVNTYPYVESVEVRSYDVSGSTITILNPTIKDVPLGIKLEVTPLVGEAGIITLKLQPEVEVVSGRLALYSYSDLGWPVIDSRACQTTVQVKSGETVIMGGLMNDDHKTYKRKVPVLGDIPVLGNLFKNNYVKRIKKNLLIFVTANRVNPSGEVLR